MTVTRISRRALVLGSTAGALATAFGALELLQRLSVVPQRQALAAEAPADVQFDLGAFTPPATTVDNVAVRFPPVHTVFATARLTGTPTRHDQQALGEALAAIEGTYPWSPAGVFTETAYGLPYFRRLDSRVVARTIPRLRGQQRRSVLEEAVVGPTDVHPSNPGISKLTFNVPVRIEHNDLLFTLRSDNADVLADVLAWLGGSNRLKGAALASPRVPIQFTSSRTMSLQVGLPRKMAEANGMPFSGRIPPKSPMWMGFVSQHVESNPPGPTVTFTGAQGHQFTSARSGDYFDTGSIQHLSHDIIDLAQWYADDEPYTERVQYMFRSTPIPSEGNADQFTDGGGPIIFPDNFQGYNDAANGAQGIGTPENEHRLGHIACLHRSSRAPDGKPRHLRADGPGFDSMDVPGGTKQPKLQFSVYVPSAALFAQIRKDAASLDLQAKFTVNPEDNGLERFLTATRRQNFLVPPRRHRAFPLVELR
ncbi:MAG: hypothetical protein V7603_2531 [Micromonosporaceae bacterium]